MFVFISWSGEKARAVAESMRAVIPAILAGRAEPFFSPEDIAKGTRGLSRISAELRRADFGVVVITPDNVHSDWINFESGALGKSLDGRVAPILVGMTDADLNGPMKEFQNSRGNDRDEMLRLFRSMNATLEAEALPEATLTTLFDAHWGELAKVIAEAEAGEPQAPQKRETADLLTEILNTVRGLQRQAPSAAEASWDVVEPAYELDPEHEYYMSMIRDLVKGKLAYWFKEEESGFFVRITKRSGPATRASEIAELASFAKDHGKSMMFLDDMNGRVYYISPEGQVDRRIRFTNAAKPKTIEFPADDALFEAES